MNKKELLGLYRDYLEAMLEDNELETIENWHKWIEEEYRTRND